MALRRIAVCAAAALLTPLGAPAQTLSDPVVDNR